MAGTRTRVPRTDVQGPLQLCSTGTDVAVPARRGAHICGARAGAGAWPEEGAWSCGGVASAERRGQRGGVAIGEVLLAWGGVVSEEAWPFPAPPLGSGAPELGAMGPGWRAASAALVGGSVAIFGGLRRAALAVPRPAAVRSRPGRAWRWRNLLVSFAHSVLAGLWALFRYRGRGERGRGTVRTLRTGRGGSETPWDHDPGGGGYGVGCWGSPRPPSQRTG